MFQFEPSDCCCTDSEKSFEPSANTGCCVIIDAISIQRIVDRSINIRTEMLVRHDKIRQFTMIAMALSAKKHSKSQLFTITVWSAHKSFASAVQVHKAATIRAKNFFSPGNISDSVLDIFKKMCYTNHCEGR